MAELSTLDDSAAIAEDEEIAEDFPALVERDLANARLAARLGQPPGRPKKRLRIEREPGARR
jgi:hypothetical protein